MSHFNLYAFAVIHCKQTASLSPVNPDESWSLRVVPGAPDPGAEAGTEPRGKFQSSLARTHAEPGPGSDQGVLGCSGGSTLVTLFGEGVGRHDLASTVTAVHRHRVGFSR